MKKKWIKKGMAIALSAAMVLGVMPQTGLSVTKVQAAENGVMTDAQFIDLNSAELSDKATAFSAYNLTGTDNAAKIRFGKNEENAREWLIAGADGENTLALLSTTAFGTSQYGTNSIYGDDTADSTVLSYLKNCMSDTTYFSASEKSNNIMKDTMVETEDYNGTKRGVTGQLYLPDAADRNSYGAILIYIGTGETKKEISLTNLVSNGGTESYFWLRSPFSSYDHFALLALPGDFVGGSDVTDEASVVPAFDLNLSSAIFASAAVAATSVDDGNGKTLAAVDKTYTLRYAPDSTTETGSNLTSADAEINKAGTKVTVTGAKSGMYLVVQSSTGAYEVPLSDTDTATTIQASSIAIGDSSLENFNNCKVWMESTNDNLTYAKQATQSTAEETTEITEVAITDLTGPVAGQALDMTATCNTTGVVNAAPDVTYTFGGQTVTGDAGYNRRYQASITVTAADGYVFNTDTTAKIGDNAATATVSEDGKTMTITYTFPGTVLKDISGDTSKNYYVEKSDLMDSFGLQTDDTVGKIIFGQNGQTDDSKAPQVWKIAGVDAGNAGDNVVLFADSELGTSVFESDWQNMKNYSSDWKCSYPAGVGITQVNPNHYGASMLRAKLNEYMTSDNTSYFSTAEKNQMNETTIYTDDTNNSTTYTTTDKLYAAYGDYTYDQYITVGTNSSDSLNNGIRIDKNNWGTGSSFWLRSPYGDNVFDALLALPGINVSSRSVTFEASVVPAFDLNLSSVIFASAATAATSSDDNELKVLDAKTYTLRYAPANGSELASASAEVSYDGKSVTVSNAKASMYLVVQKDDKAYGVALGTTDSQTIQASDVTIGETVLDSLDGCKVWIESTDADRMTSAVMATKSTTPPPITFGELTSLITETGAKLTDGTYAATNTTASVNALTNTYKAAKKLSDTAEQEEITTAYNNLAAAVEGLVSYTTTITLSSNPSNSGILTGGGKYAVGDEVTVSAKAVTGYTFAGWYVGTDVSGVAQTTDTSFTYVIQESDTALVYTAKYTANENKQLSITIGNGTVNYVYNKTSEYAGITGSFANGFENSPYAKGTYFTVTAVPDDNYEFLYWVDRNTRRVLSDSVNYSFYLSDHVQLEACYKSTAAETCYVIFKDMNGKILKSCEVTEGTAAIAPATGIFNGYTFTGWDKDFSNVTQDMVITAQYSRQSGITVAVTDGTIQDAKESYEYGTLVTVLAEEQKDNKYFSGWYIGDKLVSDQREYSFYVTENVSLTAKFDRAEVLKEQPMVIMTMSDRNTDANTGYQKVQMNVTWSVPDGYTMLEAGLVRTLSDDQQEKLDLTNVDSTIIKKNVTKLTTSAGTYAYTLTLSTASAGKNLFAKGYLSYVDDATGEIHTIYTNKYTSNKITGE